MWRVTLDSDVHILCSWVKKIQGNLVKSASDIEAGYSCSLLRVPGIGIVTFYAVDRC